MNNIFLDSGAYSAYTKKIEIDIYEYIDFIKKYEKHLTIYSVLDVIGSAEGTYENQLIMEEAGLNPVPCFHYGEDLKYLKRYLQNYDYISLGGMVMTSTPNLRAWFDDIFSKYICDSKGFPKVKVHGFGITTIELLIKYPWYSVDSTSWLMTGRFGSILVPHKTNNKPDYCKVPLKITFSNRPSKPDKYNYNNGISPLLKEYVDTYLKENKLLIGKSSFDKDGKETILENGLTNDYKIRDRANITYFLNLEKALPKWPWSFKLEKRIGRLSL